MTHVSRAVANIGSLIGGIVAPNQSEEEKDRETETVESVVPSEDDNVLSLTVSANVLFRSFSSIGVNIIVVH